MTLVLQGIALNDEPLSQPLIGRFDERGGTVGRSDNATFTLPDPERMISRVQAHVLCRDDGYWIENVSALNPIVHNGRTLSPGMRVALQDGDELRIGGYTLRAAFENDATSAEILRGRTVIRPLEGAHTEPMGSQALAQALANLPRVPHGSSPAPRSAEAPSALGGESLWRGFLEGAGVEIPLPDGPSPELLSAIGAMLRIAVGGIHRLVTMRAMAKDEMQTQRTTIQVRDNNPLKFSSDAALALKLLLQPPARGFMAGPAALRDALIDVQSHQVGMMAGMRSALEGVLDRFDPEKLEALLTTKSVFDSLRPTHRKARVWELYCKHYRALREEAQKDFQRFFGEAFREAYEAQVRSLESARDSTSPTGPGAGKGGR